MADRTVADNLTEKERNTCFRYDLHKRGTLKPNIKRAQGVYNAERGNGFGGRGGDWGGVNIVIAVIDN